MTEDQEKFHSKFSFPAIKNMLTKTLGEQLTSVKPMTQEDAAGGRPIKKYPKKWDTFDSIDTLKEYIKNRLVENNKLRAEWLDISTSWSSPFNLRDDVYYESYRIIQITCYQPAESLFQDIIHGEVICELNPFFWEEPALQYAIDEIKKELLS